MYKLNCWTDDNNRIAKSGKFVELLKVAVHNRQRLGMFFEITRPDGTVSIGCDNDGLYTDPYCPIQYPGTRYYFPGY